MALRVPEPGKAVGRKGESLYCCLKSKVLYEGERGLGVCMWGIACHLGLYHVISSSCSSTEVKRQQTRDALGSSKVIHRAALIGDVNRGSRRAKLPQEGSVTPSWKGAIPGHISAFTSRFEMPAGNVLSQSQGQRQP